MGLNRCAACPRRHDLVHAGQFARFWIADDARGIGEAEWGDLVGHLDDRELGRDRLLDSVGQIAIDPDWPDARHVDARLVEGCFDIEPTVDQHG